MTRFTAIATSAALAFSVSAASADQSKAPEAEKPVIVMSSQSGPVTSLPTLGVGGAVTTGLIGLIIIGAALSSGSH